CETVLVFVAHRGQRKAAVLHIDTTAIPLVCQLHGTVLHLSEFRVESQVGGSAEASLVCASVPQNRPELVELAWGTAGTCGVSGHMQEGVAGAHREQPSVIVEQKCARVHPAREKVIVRIPLQVA